MEIACDGMILRETAYGESDKIVTFLTAERGKITVFAKGVRSIKSRNAHAVQLFCHSDFELAEKNGRYTLKSAELLDSFYPVRDNVECFGLASYFAEIASVVCTENNDEREMLRLMLNCFYAMSNCLEVPLWRIKAAFEMQCMKINGLAPDFSVCADCGKPSVDGTDARGRYLFSPADGAPICVECLKKRHEQTAVMPLSADAVEAAQFLLTAPQRNMLRFPLPDDREKTNELCGFCEKYLIFQTGKRYETLDFYKSVRKF